MTQVVYADILIVVNTYVNYALLRITALICRKKSEPVRLALASFFGSLYSFIILAQSVPDIVIAISRAVFALVIILIAFKIKTRKDLFRLFASFFLVSFIFAGIMFALWMLFSPKAMLYNNGIVYFDINALFLAVFTIIGYALVKAADRLISFKAPKNTIYEAEFRISGYMFREKAFLDTGNSLKEPFSSLPVIICFQEIKSINKPETKLSDVVGHMEDKVRYIPCRTITSKSTLKAVRPDFIHIKGIEADFSTDEVYLALTADKIHGGDYFLLLNAAIFENNTNETEKDYV